MSEIYFITFIVSLHNETWNISFAQTVNKRYETDFPDTRIYK